MTDIEFEAAEKTRRWKKTLSAAGLGAVAGFLGALGALHLMDSGAIADFGESVEIAVLVGVVYVLIAVAVAVGVLSPKAGATFLNVEDAEELEEQRPMLAYSAVVMAGAGIALIVVALAGAAAIIAPGVALGIYVALAIIATWISIKAWKLQDEFMRAMGRDCASLSYYLVLGVGGTWALLAHLGFVPAPQPLDWLTMLWSLMLLACFIVVGRRGMLMMR